MATAILLLALSMLPQATTAVNPVAATAESMTRGSKLYGRYCTTCHGPAGQGDGPAGKILDPKPANLADAEWKHGSTDGEMFLVIRGGAKDTGMKGFASRMTERELWDLVNYIRSLGPK